MKQDDFCCGHSALHIPNLSKIASSVPEICDFKNWLSFFVFFLFFSHTYKNCYKMRTTYHHSKSFIEAISFQQSRESSVRKAKLDTYSKTSSELRQQLESTLQHAVELASVKRASNWLTTLPLNEHGFALHKSSFQDALALRYGWPPLRTPTLCACGASFSVDHVLSCPKGGLPSLRHNEIRDLTATLLTEVCSQVCTEPELQPVHKPDEFHLSTSNTQEGACLDIAMNGFWGSRSERFY